MFQVKSSSFGTIGAKPIFQGPSTNGNGSGYSALSHPRKSIGDSFNLKPLPVKEIAILSTAVGAFSSAMLTLSKMIPKTLLSEVLLGSAGSAAAGALICGSGGAFYASLWNYIVDKKKTPHFG